MPFIHISFPPINKKQEQLKNQPFHMSSDSMFKKNKHISRIRGGIHLIVPKKNFGQCSKPLCYSIILVIGISWILTYSHYAQNKFNMLLIVQPTIIIYNISIIHHQPPAGDPHGIGAKRLVVLRQRGLHWCAALQALALGALLGPVLRVGRPAMFCSAEKTWESLYNSDSYYM